MQKRICQYSTTSYSIQKADFTGTRETTTDKITKRFIKYKRHKIKIHDDCLQINVSYKMDIQHVFS